MIFFNCIFLILIFFYLFDDLTFLIFDISIFDIFYFRYFIFEIFYFRFFSYFYFFIYAFYFCNLWKKFFRVIKYFFRVENFFRIKKYILGQKIFLPGWKKKLLLNFYSLCSVDMCCSFLPYLAICLIISPLLVFLLHYLFHINNKQIIILI